MAEQQAIGKALLISDDVIKRLDEADKKINKIAEDSDNMAKTFSSAIGKMSNSTGDLLERLEKVKSIMGVLGKTNFSGINGLSKASNEAEKVAGSITKAATAINQFSGESMNIAQLTARIKELNKQLTTGEGVKDADEQQMLVNQKRALEEMLKSQKRSEEDIAAITQKENEREEKYLARKQAALDKMVASYERMQETQNKSSEVSGSSTADWVVKRKEQELKAQQEAQKASDNFYKSEQERLEKIAKEEDERRKAKQKYYEESLKYAQELDRKEEAAAKQRLAEEKRLAAEKERSYKQQAASYREQNYKQNTTVSGSLAFAETANTIARRTQAIQYLTEARRNLSATDANYTTKLNQLNAAIKRMNELNAQAVRGSSRVAESHRSLMNTSDQLARKLALIFSVSQIQGYIEKLIRVRGEFELQNTALASILQNKEKADLLFGQITELAVKSPFTVKELVTYTKSLSAYQVEYEKLYDTTKMLADVSAGLGVDMQRLILAFGQVKAANFLRGTETRQFTEAGINMLGELAKYYSELEGRIVSVSEVQDRQFKKMIAFKDVEEVFKRLTSAGGMFYNMQEKQAETLAGQWSNLQDSIDIMLNDIGKENQGTLSGMISAIKSIIENWRTVADVVEPIVTMLLTQRLLVKGIVPLIGYISNAFKIVTSSINGASVAQDKFNAAAKANAWITVGTIIIGALWEVKNAIVAVTRAQDELNQIIADGAYNSQMSQANYERLANIVASSTASYKEQKEALDELKRTYSEILPQHYLEADAIKAMKGNYEEATAAINEYIAAKTKEKEIQQLNETYGKELSDAQKELAEYIKDSIRIAGRAPEMTEINVVIAEFRRQFEAGLVKTVDDANKLLNDLLSKRFGQDVKLSFAESSFDWLTMSPSASYPLEAFYNTLVRLQDKVKEVNSSTLAFEDATTISLKEKREILDSQLKEVTTALDLIATKYSGGAGSELISDKQIADAKAKIEEYAGYWGIPKEKIEELKGGAYEISQISNEIRVAALRSFANEIRNMKFPTNQLASAQMYLQGIQKEIDGLNATPFQKYISNIIISLAQLNNVSLDGLVDAFAKAGESIDDYSKRIAGKAETLRESLRLFAVSPYLVPEWNGSKQKAEEAEKLLKVYEGSSKSVTPESDKDIKKRQAAANKAHKSELDKLKERIELIKKAGDEYKKLLDYYDKGTAKQKVIDAFSDSFKDLGLSIDMDFDISGVIKKIENLTNKAGKEGAKAINEALAPLKSERDIELQTQGLDTLKKKLDGMFAGYELSIELQKEGLDENLVEQLFNVDTFSLDDLKKKLAELEPELRKYGDKGVEVFKDADKKITDNEQKELNERLKKYSTYLKQSVTERVKIELEAQKQIAEVQATSEFTPQQKSSIINKIKEEAAKKKDEQTWKDFQGTDLYIKMFEDLESASTKALDFMLSKLEGLRDGLKNLSPTELKEVISQMDKIQEISISRNPFKGFSENLKEVIKYQKEAKKLNDEYIEAVRQQDLLKGMVENQQLATEEEKKRYNEIVKINGASSEEAQNAKENLTIQEELLDNLLKQLVAQGKITDESAEQIRRGSQQTNNLKNRYNEILNGAAQTTNSLTSMLDDLGIEIDESTRQALEGVGQIFSSFAEMDITKPFSIITSTMGVIGGIGKTISSFFSKSDASYEREIERQQKLVENLQRSYEKLYDTIENGLSLDAYSENATLIKNLRRQIDSYQAMIAAEQDKKNRDDSRIQEWKDSIDELYSQIDELYRNLKTELIGDFRDIAQQLGDAIAEAFQNGTDAAEAWGDSVNEIIAKMVQNLLVQKLLEPRLQEIVDQMFEDAMPNASAASQTSDKINDLKKEYSKLLTAVDEDIANGIMPIQKLERLKQIEKELAELQKQLDEYNAAAEDEVPNITQDIVDNTIGSLLDLRDEALSNPAWDILKDLYAQSGDTMSGLEKGIQGISEETGQALEALLNSMRFYVADTNTDIKNIYNFLVNMPIESPLMQEMKVQSNYLSSINSLLNSVSKNVPSNGRALKVQIV